MARLTTVSIAFCLSAALSAAGEPEEEAQNFEASVFTVLWNDEARSPAVCAGRPKWFLSVVPVAVEVDEALEPRLLCGDESYILKVLHFDPAHRLALLESALRVPGAVPLKQSRTSRLKPGSDLICLASGDFCRTTVAGKDNAYLGRPFHQPLLRVRIEDAERFCCPGTPLINAEGELVGILTEGKLAADGEAHAIPSVQLRKLVSDFKRHRRSGLVWIGLVFHDLSTTPQVLEVRPDSPGMRAGVETGDIVVELDGIEIDHIDALTEAVYGLPAGRETSMKVLRSLETIDLTLVPEFARDAAPSP